MTLSLSAARECLTVVPPPPIVYTVDDVESCFGVTFTPEQREALDLIPFSESVLRASAGTHMLFPSAVLSLLDIRAKHPDLFYSKGDDAWYAKEQQAFSRVPLPVQWNLLRTTAVPGSFSKPWTEQLLLLQDDEEVPPAALVAFATVLHFRKTQQRLFPSYYVRCQDVDAGRFRVDVGNCDGGGLGVFSSWDGFRSSSVGVAAVRKF